VLYLLNPAYAAYGVACAVTLVAISLATDAATRRPLAEANQSSARGLNGMIWTLRNTELIESMGMLPAIARRWQVSQEPVLRDLARGTRHSKAFGAFARGFRLLMQAGMIALGAILVVHHETAPASMLGANLILTKLLTPFDQLVSGWRQWVFAIAAYRRVRDLIGRDARRRAPDTVGFDNVEGRLVVDRVTYVVPAMDRSVLRDISFEVGPGEAIGIIGPSGSGKSTLARLLVGTIEPTAGSVELDGQSTYRWSRADFARHVGYLPQSVSLLDGTVFENIARMSDADPADVVHAAKQADVHTMIGRLPQGYTTPIGNGLSGGQKQRVALARALFGRPRLLVLDEPNSGLDREGEAALLRTVEAAKADGAAVVIIAHRPSALAAVDLLLVLKDGAVEHFGPRDEVARALSIDLPADAETRPAVSPAVLPAAVIG
jgi:ATP-binding cassette subfamily C protein